MVGSELVEKLAYEAGRVVGRAIAVPFTKGLLDELKPEIDELTKELVPRWLHRFL